MTQVAGTIRNMKFTVAVTHEAPWYVARCLDVDVVSQGETVDDAVANLEEAPEGRSLQFFDSPALP